MGVIHKLNENVISFIIDEKKNNPSISVRKLSALTSEKFQINVSKSSVSTVLKNAALSSSVGRRAMGKSKKEKFTLPDFRKEEISGNMQKLGLTKNEPVSKVAKPEPVEQNFQEDGPLPLLPDPIAQEKPVQVQIKENEEPSAKDFQVDQAFLDRVEQIRSEKTERKGAEFKGMGYIFLQAALWEISSRPILAEMFGRHIAQGPNRDVFDRACDMYTLFHFLGVKNYEELLNYRAHGLWHIIVSGMESSDEEKVLQKVRELFEWAATADKAMQNRVSVEYELERGQMFSQANNYRLFLEDETQLNFDAHLATVSRKPVQGLDNQNTIPVNKALAWLSSYLVSNNSDLILRVVPGITEFNSIFFDMIAVFENLSGKKIIKISVLSGDEEVLTDFSTIPRKKRSFIVGVSPNQKEFAQLTGNVKWAGKKSFYHEETDQVLYFTETKTNIFEAKFQEKIRELRTIAIWKENEKEPLWVLLTNKGKGDSQDILYSYVSRWPYFMLNDLEASISGEISEISTQKCGKIEFHDVLNDFIEELNRYCQKQFFPSNNCKNDVNTMVQTIYESPGNIALTDREISVSLNMPKTSPQRKNIEHAIRKVNESHIFREFRRKLWLKI